MPAIASFLEKINPVDKGSSSSVEYFLSLLVNEKRVKSAIWSVDKEGKKNIIFGNPESWGNGLQELIVASDASIASAVTKLSRLEGKQPSKVILGIPESWVYENSIEPEKQALFKEVCRKMELKPAGFIVTPEAIAHYLKSEEGGLPSLIIVNIEETEITVSLILKGKFLGSKLVGRSDNLALDLEEGLLRFNISDNLPNRILLIDDTESYNIEEARQTLVAYPWVSPDAEKKLNFLQLPKIEVADPNFEIKAVVLAGFKEMNPEEEKDSALPDLKEEKEETALNFPGEATGEKTEDFGFMKGEDVLLAGSYIPETKSFSEVEEDIQDSQTVYSVESKEEMTEGKNTEFPKTKKALPIFNSLKIALSGLKGIKLSKPKFKLKTRKGVFVIIGIFLITTCFVIFSFWNWAKAEVKIIVMPQRIDKEFEFTVSAEAEEVNFQKMLVPARKLTHQVSSSKSTEVTGKKTVGEKAKGEIVIYNRTEQTKKVPKGTILKGTGGVQFVLDEEINVASKTADLEMGVDKWGEVKTTATAFDIGAQYNITPDSVLSFETISSSNLLVKNPSSFSGGTSREIQAVSKADRENLQKELLSELEEIAMLEMKNSVSGQDFLLEDSFKLESKLDSFNHEVDDEATSLSLEEKAEFSILFVKEEDFLALVKQVVAEEINEGYRHEVSFGDRDFSLIDSKKGIYKASVKEKFLPDIDTTVIPAQLKRKSLKTGEKILTEINKVSGMSISISPKPFSYLKFFPLKEQNIHVFVETLE